MDVCVQRQPFDPAAEYAALIARAAGAAVATFTGYVRDFAADGPVSQLELEHYPGMAEAVLSELGERTAKRFALRGWRIVHRFGALSAGDIIVWVGTVADHRAEAFAACECLMDTLKTEAPFWKREHHPDGGGAWVDASHDDLQRRERWS